MHAVDDSTRVGTVYLLHFDRPIAHAQHYIGFSQHLEDRLTAHRSGSSGVPMINEFHNRGIGFTVARLWEDKHQSLERRYKTATKNARRLCPICRQEKSHAV